MSAGGRRQSFFVFFFNDTATTEIYTLSLHDALPISARRGRAPHDARRIQDLERRAQAAPTARSVEPLKSVNEGSPQEARGADTGRPSSKNGFPPLAAERSEEHTSELQSRLHLVCRLL